MPEDFRLNCYKTLLTIFSSNNVQNFLGHFNVYKMSMNKLTDLAIFHKMCFFKVDDKI